MIHYLGYNLCAKKKIVNMHYIFKEMQKYANIFPNLYQTLNKFYLKSESN